MLQSSRCLLLPAGKAPAVAACRRTASPRLANARSTAIAATNAKSEARCFNSAKVSFQKPKKVQRSLVLSRASSEEDSSPASGASLEVTTDEETEELPEPSIL